MYRPPSRPKTAPANVNGHRFRERDKTKERRWAQARAKAGRWLGEMELGVAGVLLHGVKWISFINMMYHWVVQVLVRCFVLVHSVVNCHGDSRLEKNAEVTCVEADLIARVWSTL